MKCKGEALLLSSRLAECEAAQLIFELGSAPVDTACQDDVINAVALLKDMWHLIPVSLKAALAQRQATVHMQDLLKYCNRSEDEEERDLNDFLEPMFDTLFPVTHAEDSVFDASIPTMHAVCAELFYQVSEKLDLSTVDPDEPGELDLPFRKAAQAVFGSGPADFFR